MIKNVILKGITNLRDSGLNTKAVFAQGGSQTVLNNAEILGISVLYTFHALPGNLPVRSVYINDTTSMIKAMMARPACAATMPMGSLFFFIPR